MFEIAHYLHYVLDTKEDPHYTKDLLKLSPPAYLWQELKERHRFDNVVFVETGEGGLWLRVYDTGSAEVLRPVKKGWFSSGKKEREERPEPQCFSLAQLKQQPGTLLPWLLECQKNRKSERTALIFTADALRSAYDRCDRKGKELLHKYIKDGTQSGVLIIRIDKDAPTLEGTFLDGARWLSELDPMVRSALQGYGTRPLLTALSEQLCSQLVDFSGYEGELLPMLQREALDKSFGLDSPDELQEQARYLALCCQKGMLCDQDPDAPIKRSQINSYVSRRENREALRSQTRQLRQESDSLSMEELFARHHGNLPTIRRQVLFDDELTRTVAALILPQDYLEKNRGQARTLLQLKQGVQTLWNKPRNRTVVRMLRDACDGVRQACEDGDWDTVTDGMTLLSLCTRQLCADPALNDNLDRIFEVGRELLLTASEYFHQRRTLAAESRDELELYQISKAQLTVQLGNEAILDAKRQRLESLRGSLGQAILYFNDNPRSERVEVLLQQSMEEWKKRLDQVTDAYDGGEDLSDHSSAYDL